MQHPQQEQAAAEDEPREQADVVVSDGSAQEVESQEAESRTNDITVVSNRPAQEEESQEAESRTGDIFVVSDGPAQEAESGTGDIPVAVINDGPAQEVESVTGGPAQEVESQKVESVTGGSAQEVESQKVESMTGGPAQGVESMTGGPAQEVESMTGGPAQEVESQKVESATDGPSQEVESAVGHVSVSEPQADKLMLQRDVLAECITTHSSNNSNTSVSQEELEIKDDIVSDRPTDPVAQDPPRVVSDLDVTTDESPEACFDNHDSTLVESTDVSSGELFHHSVDAAVTIDGSASELEAEQDVGDDDSDKEMLPSYVAGMCQNSVEVIRLDVDLPSDSVAEVEMTCRHSSSISQCQVAEQTESASAIVEKLPYNTELDSTETCVSVMSEMCTDAEMKTHPDSVARLSGSHCDVRDAADEVPAVTTETDFNAVSEGIMVDDEDELVGEPDDRVACAELTCMRSVNAETTIHVENENVLSEVSTGPVAETEDLAGTVESSKLEHTVMKCGEVLELVDECDNPALHIEKNCGRNVNVQVPVDMSVETVSAVTSAGHVHENEPSLNIVENSELDEYDTVSHTEVNCVGIMHAVAEAGDKMSDEHVSSEDDADPVCETETPEDAMGRPDALLQLQPAVNTPVEDSIASEESVRIDETQLVTSSRNDIVVSCEVVQEMEVCCTKTDKQSSTTDSVIEHDGELLKQPAVVEPVGELMEESSSNNSERNLELLERRETVEAVAEVCEELLRQPDSTDSIESRSEHDGLLPTHLCADKQVAEESGELQELAELLKQPETLEPVVEDAAERQKHSDVVESTLEHDHEIFKPANAVEPDDGEILEQLSSVVSVGEDDRELVKWCENITPVVEEAGEVVQLVSSTEAVLEHDEEVLKQCENVELVLDCDRELVKQHNSADNVDSVPQYNEELLKQSESVEPVVEEQLSKQCDDIELVVEGGELLEPSSNVDLMLQRDTELSECSEMVEQVAEDGGDLSKHLDTDDLIVEYNAAIWKQSEDCESAILHESMQLNQLQDDDVTKLVTVADGVMELDVVDTVTDNADDNPVYSEAAEEHDAHVLTPRDDAESNVSDEVLTSTTSDLSVDAAVETSAEVGLQPCESPVVREPESTAGTADAVLVTSQSEPAEQFAIPSSEFVQCIDVSCGAELEAVMPEEKEMATAMNADDVPGAGMPLEDLEVRPVLSSSSHEEQDDRTVMSTGDSDTGVELQMQISDTDTEVCLPSVGAVAQNSIECSETEAQHAVYHTEQSEQKIDSYHSDPTALNNLHSEDASSCGDIISMPAPVMPDCNSHTAVRQEELEVKDDAVCDMPTDPTTQDPCIVVNELASTTDEVVMNSEDTIQNEVVMSTVDRDAVISDDTVESAVRGTVVVSCSSEDIVESRVVSLAADKDMAVSAMSSQDPGTLVTAAVVNNTSLCAVTSEDTVPSGLMIYTADEDTAVLPASSEDTVETVDKNVAICTDSLDKDGDAERPSEKAAVCSHVKHDADTIAAAGADNSDDNEGDAGGSGVRDRNELIISVSAENKAVCAQSSEDTVQSDAVISTTDKETVVGSVSTDDFVHSEDLSSVVEKDTVVSAVSLEDMDVDRVATSVAHNDTVTFTEDTMQRSGLIVMHNEDTSVRGVEQCEMKISTADNNSLTLTDTVQLQNMADKDVDVCSVTSENLLPNGVMISATNDDKAVPDTSLQSTVQSGIVVSTAEEDSTAVTSNCDSVHDTAQHMKTAPVPTDICTAVYPYPTDDTVAHAASQHLSDSSVEEGQFDDVESDDDVKRATPTDVHRQLHHVSPVLRQRCQSVGSAYPRTSDVRRSLHAVSSSSHTLSPAGTFSRSPVASRNVMSPVVQQMAGRSPLLSSPVCQNVDQVGRPGMRPRFPQSPIMPHNGAHLYGAGLQVQGSVSRDVSAVIRNMAPASGGKTRKRKRSVDDREVDSKRSLVADFTTVVVSDGDVGPTVISSGCDRADVTVSDVAGSLTHTAAEGDVTAVVSDSNIGPAADDNNVTVTDVAGTLSQAAAAADITAIISDSDMGPDADDNNVTVTDVAGTLSQAAAAGGDITTVISECDMGPTADAVVDCDNNATVTDVAGMLSQAAAAADITTVISDSDIGPAADTVIDCDNNVTVTDVAGTLTQADAAADITAIISDCDMGPATDAVISSCCDSSDVTVTCTTTVAAATGENLHHQDETSIVTTLQQPISSVLGDNCSVETNCSSTESSRVMSDEGKVLIETRSSVVDSILSQKEDTASARSGLLNSDAEASERAEVVEDMEEGFTLVNTGVCLSAEVVEGTESNTAAKSVECLTINGNDGNLSSELNEVTSSVQTSAADVGETLQLNSAENAELAAEPSNGCGSEVGDAANELTVVVTDSTCHEQHINECTEEQWLLKATCAGQLPDSSIACDVVRNISSDSSSLTVQARTDPVSSLSVISETSNELSNSVSGDVQRISVNAPSLLLMENSSRVADPSQTLPSLSQADLPCNRLVTFCTQDDMFSDVAAKSEMERSDLEMCTAVTSTVDMLTASCSASQFVLQVTDDEISASQATDGDVFASQCISQAAPNDNIASYSLADTNSDVGDLHLFLEMSQKPNSMDTSVLSQYMAAENEAHISCIQTSSRSDADGFHLYLEPSQEPNSRDVFDRKKAHLTEDFILSEKKDVVSTDGENLPETAGKSDIMMEFRESNHTTVGGFDEDTGKEEEDAVVTLDLTDDNHCDVHVHEHGDKPPLSSSHEHCHCESQLDATLLLGCPESGGVNEQITNVEDVNGLQTKDVIDSFESELTDKTCEAAVFNSYDNVDEFNTVEGPVLPAVVEEEESDESVTESSDVDVASNVDRSGYSTADSDEDVAELYVTADASLMKCQAVADDDDESDDKAEDDVGLDVTESISGVDSDAEKYLNVTQSSEKNAVCSPVKNDVPTVAAVAVGSDDDDDDDDSEAGDSDDDNVRIPYFGADKDVDAEQLSENAAAKHDADKAAAAANTSDDAEDNADGLDVTDSISDVGNSSDKDVDLVESPENAVIYSPLESVARAVDAADEDDDNPDDDDDDDDDDGGDASDVTESISDVGSDVGHLSEIEENVQDASDNVSALSPRSIRRLLTKRPPSDGDVLSYAGEHC